MRIPHGLRAALAGQGGAAPATDSDFENVSLLLHGDGTNGAQNNTFTDGSTNNFTITRNGNTTQGTFSPFSPTGWSAYFDGTGDYLSTSATALPTGSANYTIEAWFYSNSATKQTIIYWGTGASNQAIGLTVNSNGSVFHWWFANDLTTTGVNVLDNAWHHIVATFNGTTRKIFVDGIQRASDTPTGKNTVGTNATIGYQPNIGGETNHLLGYVSNLRVVAGLVYDVSSSTLTVPTAPLTAITNTSLLTLQDNRFKDNSTNNFAITRNGDTKIEAFSPFNPTAAYSASTHGGSGYFDGTGDWLTAASNAAFDVSASAYTFESWIYWTGVTTNSTMLFGLLGSANSTGYVAAFTESNTLYWQQVGTGTNQTTASFTPVVGQWYHIAIGWNGSNSLAIWINGTRVATNTVTPTSAGQAGVNVGGRSSGSALTGYISNFRLVKGTDVYGVGNSTITVPTAPLTAITNTSLLLNFTNGGIIDNASKNVLETVGNAQISTSVKKFGTGSMYFDGSTYLISPPNLSSALGTADFTVEAWVYASGTQTRFANIASSASLSWYLSFENSNQVFFFISSAGNGVFSSSNLTSNAWVHVAASRSGTTLRLFFDGVQVGSITLSASAGTSSDPVRVGTNGVGHFFNGYIDDLRITRGVARYTANFTPPTAAFPDL